MVSASKEAAGKWYLITGRKQRVTKLLRSDLTPFNIPGMFQTHEVTP